MAKDQDVWDRLGLVFENGLRPVPLDHGLVLVMRAPETPDWLAARVVISEMAGAADIVSRARKRYGFTGEDVVDMLEPLGGEGAAQLALHAELGVRIIQTIRGPKGEIDKPGLPEVLQVLRLGDNFDLFRAAVREAEAGLVTAKKEPPPSPAGSGAAAANTVKDAGSSIPPAGAASRNKPAKSARKG